MQHKRATGPVVLVLYLTLAVVAGCGGSSASDGGQGGAGGQAGVEDTLYAVCGLFFTPQGLAGFMGVVPDLLPETTFSLSEAAELTNGASCAAPGNSNRIYVTNTERGVIERYLVEDDGLIVLDDEVSLTSLGINAPTGLDPLHLVSPSRGYLIDQATVTVVQWDPEDMVITGSFSVEGALKDGLRHAFNYVARDGDRMIMPVRYFRSDDTAEPVSLAIVIDTTDDSVTYAEDTRCGNLAFTASASNGDMYFASHPGSAAALVTGQAGQPASSPCLLRIRSGANEFDPGFYVELNELTGGRPTGTLLQGTGDTLYVLAYDEEVIPLTDSIINAGAQTVINQRSWRFWALDVSGDVSSAAEVDFAPTIGLSTGFSVDQPEGAIPYVVTVAADFSSGTLIDIRDPGGFVPALAAPAIPQLAIRVR
ncbi:MAG: hypothetical protein AAF500_15665 [Myxococcota bacterium]